MNADIEQLVTAIRAGCTTTELIASAEAVASRPEET